MTAHSKVFGISIHTQRRRRALVLLCYAFLLLVPAVAWQLDRSTRSITACTIYATVAVNALAFGGYGSYRRFGLVKGFNNQPPRESSVQSQLISIHLEQLTHLPLTRTPSDQSWQNDEREISRRDAVHFRAYQPLTLTLAVIVLLADWSLHRPVWLPEKLLPILLYSVSLPAVILAFTLPQAIILWSEPDLNEPDSTEHLTTSAQPLDSPPPPCPMQ